MDETALQGKIDDWFNRMIDLDHQLMWQMRQSDQRIGLMEIWESVEKLHQIRLEATACYTSIVLTDDPVDQGLLTLITGFLVEDLLELQEKLMEAESALLCEIANHNDLKRYLDGDSMATISVVPPDKIIETKIIPITTASTKLAKPGS